MKSAKYGVNLVYDLGTKGYFEPGFASVDFTSACNLFFGGSGAIFYTGSGQINLAEDMYDNGETWILPCAGYRRNGQYVYKHTDSCRICGRI